MASKKITITIGTDVDLTDVKTLEDLLQKIDDEPITPEVDTTSAQLGIQNISQGFNELKQGASELKTVLGETLDAAGQMEQTEAFLSMNLGADQAKKRLQEIRSVTDKLPGDDVALQNLLSQAALKDSSMTVDAFTQMGGAAADYMAAMSNFGKSATETQQDLMNYILAGNTAEIERSPILQAHVDKLKEGTTVQERSKLLQEALTEEGWNGIASQDIYNNKLQTFNDLLTRGQMNLGNLFLEPTEQLMGFIGELDDATGGLIGMSVAAAQMATPLFHSAQGIVQMAVGINGLRGEGGVIDSVKTKFHNLRTSITETAMSIKNNLMGAFTSLKNTMTGTVIPALKNVATSMFNAGKAALTAGLNALKSAAMWVAQKVQMIASTAATYAMAAAQALLNIIMSMNPIMLVVIAIIALIAVLVYLYYNVDSVRQVIDNLGASIVATAQWIYNGFMSIVSTISGALGSAWGAVSRFVSNLVSGLVNGASRAVSGFVNYIRQIPQMVMGEFNRTLQLVGEFISSLPSRVWDMGTAIIGALKSALGIGSPGYMYYMVEGEFNRIDDLTKKTNFDTGSIGQSMVDSFNPSLQTGNASLTNGATGNNITINIDSVDNEERIQQIVRAVEDALKFDNVKAGRTV